MNKLTVLLFATFCVVTINTIVLAQVIDSFSDGDFTTNPAWSGETSGWQIVTAPNSNTLHLICSNEGFCTDYLSLQRTDAWGTQQSWGFWLGRYENAGTDAANASFVWLWANESNFESSSICGYRVRIGGFGIGIQKIYLERVDSGNPSIIMTSSSEISSHMVSDYGLLIRVTRTNESLWSLYCSTIPTQSGEGAIATDIPSAANTP